MRLSKQKAVLTEQDFEEKLTQGQKIITNWVEFYADLDTPVSIYSKLKKFSPDAFLFESVFGGENVGRYSYIGYKALEILKTDSNANPYDLLEKRITELNIESELQNLSIDADLPFFHKGYAGILSFDSFAQIEPSIKASVKASSFPTAYQQLIGSMVVFDHVKMKLYLVVNVLVEDTKSVNKKQAEKLYDKSIAELRELETVITQEHDLNHLQYELDRKDLVGAKDLEIKSNIGKEEFMQMVEKAKEHIKAGDIFQIVPSHKFYAEQKSDPLQVYRVLRTINPSPYLFIFNLKDLDDNEISLVGSSPELHLGSKLVKNEDESLHVEAELRPIAGTYKRTNNSALDEKLAKEILQDPKEVAEHVMLIDLARNDLGRVCEQGSITVPEKLVIEKYSHVLHIVSKVTGKAKAKYGKLAGIKLMRATFPAGTLSGTPKISAIELINKLESQARAAYGGCIGYFGLDGSSNTGIIIRTITIEHNKLSVQAGAGVVADSVPEKEWQETYNKASALIEAIATCI